MASVDMRRADRGCDACVARRRIRETLFALAKSNRKATQHLLRRWYGGEIRTPTHVRATGGMMLENSRVGMRAPPRSI